MGLRVLLISIALGFGMTMSAQLFAQVDPLCHGHLAGRVLAAPDSAPVGYATVWIKELKIGALTDSAGYYHLDHICEGHYTLVCQHGAHEPMELQLRPSGMDADSLLVMMTPRTLQLSEVQIRGQRLPDAPTQAAASIKGFEMDMIRSQPLGEGLARLPGMGVLRTGATIAKPVLHGLHSNRLLMLNNGIRHEGQQWGSEHAPEIDPALATQLTVIKGAAAVRYGADALAGVVLVSPPALPASAGAGGEWQSSFYSNGRGVQAHGALEGRAKGAPFAWRLQGSLKRAGNLHTPDYFLINTGVAEGNGSAALSYGTERRHIDLFYSRFATQIGIFSAAHIGNLTDLRRAIAAEQPLESGGFSYQIARPFQRIRHHLLKAVYSQSLPGGGRLSFTYAWQKNIRLEYDKHLSRGGDADAPQYDFNLATHFAEGFWAHQRGNFRGQLGLSGMYQDNAARLRSFIPNFVSASGGAFVIERWHKERLEVEAGARYDLRWIYSARAVPGGVAYDQRVFHNLSGTFGATYRFNEKLKGALNAGSAFRPPHVSELFANGLHHGSASVEIGNAELRPERSRQLIASLTREGAGRWQASLSVYYHLIRDFIYLRPDTAPTLTIRGAFPTFRYSQVNARLMGADLTAGYRLSALWTLTATAAWLDAQNQSAGEALVLMPPNRFSGGIKFTPGDAGKWRSPFLSLAAAHTLRQYRVPPQQDYSDPPPAFTLIQAEGGISREAGPLNWTAGLRIDNLLNTRYRDYLNRFRYFANETGRNVSFFLKCTF